MIEVGASAPILYTICMKLEIQYAKINMQCMHLASVAVP